MTFASDMNSDRAVFLDTDEFGESATYKVCATGVTSTITVIAEEQIFAITDDKQNKKFHASAADVAAPARGDYITDAQSVVWTVVDVQRVGTMWELRCVTPQSVA